MIEMFRSDVCARSDQTSDNAERAVQPVQYTFGHGNVVRTNGFGRQIFVVFAHLQAVIYKSLLDISIDRSRERGGIDDNNAFRIDMSAALVEIKRPDHAVTPVKCEHFRMQLIVSLEFEQADIIVDISFPRIIVIGKSDVARIV